MRRGRSDPKYPVVEKTQVGRKRNIREKKGESKVENRIYRRKDPKITAIQETVTFKALKRGGTKTSSHFL